MKTVSCIIISKDGRQLLERCLGSVGEQSLSPGEIIVFDNGSQDDSVEYLKSRWPAVKVLNSRENLGFCRPNNIAIRKSCGEYVVLLNNDVILDRDFITRIVQRMEQEEDVGIGCGKLLLMNPDGDRTDVIDCVGLYRGKDGNVLNRGKGERDQGQYDKEAFVFGASFAAVVLKRRMIEEVALGGELLDEDFWAYFEDADLCWRAQRLGWRCVYVPSAKGYHIRGATIKEIQHLSPKSNMRYLCTRNRYWMLIKNEKGEYFLKNFFSLLFFEAKLFLWGLFRDGAYLHGQCDAMKRIGRALRKRRLLSERIQGG